ncbi:hypothetical protein MNBD_GAMMA09-1555, partial [hydrothermal vent metagenome]
MEGQNPRAEAGLDPVYFLLLKWLAWLVSRSSGKPKYFSGPASVGRPLYSRDNYPLLRPANPGRSYGRVSPSSSRSLLFICTPPAASAKPPIAPDAITTLWHGIMIGSLFLPQALPTARYALGEPPCPMRAAAAATR